ncbi:extracellular solute-binding protein [Paenibacillus sp. N4]|uniref:extracellular solute-binding protein n=1 Tax=Paenibacillus vietnamensis TaxID=2590547 RepID=UPI001CD06EBC|nr:extracellular solute-binding protein [Paenibacillus vietnamensis]MCA0755410.1 extracellular solute-binding protein [Paenibacillus vietnamensis]
MKDAKKKWLGMTAAALSVSLVLSGCSGNNGGNNEGSNDPKPSNGAETPAAEAPIEITWANNFNTPEKDGNYVQTELEKKFNVKIKNVKLERGTWKEQFSVLLASGDIPDIFPIDATETDMVTWADQGIIASVDQAEIEAQMPKYAAALNSVDPGAWGVGLYNGKNWGIPKVWPGGLDGFMPGYNEAWLKNIGYSEPPKTLEELEDVLTKFVNDDPDKNGQKDTFGLTGRGKLTEQLFTSIFSAHGVSPYQYKIGADGKLVYGGITEETRAALKLLNKWYKSGLIDPEFITTDNNEINIKFANQKIGMVDNMKWGNFHKDSGFVAKPGLEKGQVIRPGSPLLAPDGKTYGFAYGARQAPVLLGKQLEEDEKKRHKIMEILEYVSTDSEGFLLTGFGQPGVSYDMQGDLAVPRPDENAAAPKLGAGNFYNPLSSIDVSMQKHTTQPDVLELKEKLSPLVVPMFDALGPAVLTSKPKYWGNLKTLQDTYLIKAITGEANTDGDFYSFKENWLRSGGQEVTDEVNKVYSERK